MRVRDRATEQAPISRDTPSTDLQCSTYRIGNVGREKSDSERTYAYRQFYATCGLGGEEEGNVACPNTLIELCEKEEINVAYCDYA